MPLGTSQVRFRSLCCVGDSAAPLVAPLAAMSEHQPHTSADDGWDNDNSDDYDDDEFDDESRVEVPLRKRTSRVEVLPQTTTL
jgi:hypothetical protein